MKYIRLENGIPINYSIEQFSIDYPNAKIYSNTSMPDSQLLLQYNVYPLVTTNPPETTETQIAEEGLPSFYNGEWYQTWTIRDLRQEEIDAAIADQMTIPADAETGVLFFASEETINQRLEICDSCPSYNKLKICSECGCIMPLKVRIKALVCPLAKW